MLTVLGPDICENILFVHAISGCDTTYALYGVRTALKLVNTNKIFLEQAKVFSTHGIMADGVVAAREDKRHWLYKGQPGDSLNILRLHQFHYKVGKSKSLVQPEVLPPSSAAAKYHSLRVYYQVQEWMGRRDISAESWGWNRKNNKYAPVLTDRPPAPNELLEIVRCNCKSD